MLPQKIDRYEIKAELGRGGMAAVYKAIDPRFKREVAIKILPAAFMHDAMFRARFEREAQTIASLEFPGIVPVYDYGDENGQTYLVMRYMPGGSLADLLKQGPLPIDEVKRIFERLTSALDYVHSKGIIHRDLKPANILFDLHGNAYLSDFGIVHLADASIALTGDALIGTPSYMSPEQARGDGDIDHRSDIYALGAILFEMLSGRLPYEATTPMGIAMKHLIEPVPRILAVKADLPAACEDLIARAMAKERDKRFQTASEMAHALEAIAVQAGASPSKTLTPAAAPEVIPATSKPARPVTPPPSQPSAGGRPITPLPVPTLPPQPAAPARLATPLPVPAPPSQPGGTPAPARPASSPAIARPQKKKIPWTVWTLGGAAILAIILCIASAVGGGLWVAFNPSATPEPTTAVNLAASPTPPSGDANPVLTTSTAPPLGGVIFQDDFSDPQSGWSTYQGIDGLMNYEAGSYHILVDVPNTWFWATTEVKLADASIEVQAEKVAGPDDNVLGLICRYQDDNNFYLLLISSDGYYGILKRMNGSMTVFGDGMQYSQIIHQGKTSNTLRADCIGNTITLYANGTRLAQATDSTFSEGAPGLIVGTYNTAGTDIVFDNFIISEP